MAEECSTSQIPSIKEDDTQMECDMPELKSTKTDGSASDKGPLALPVSGATSAAASTPVSDSECAMSPAEDLPVKEGALTLPVSGATSAAASTPVSDSECGAMSPAEDVPVKEGALTLPVSGATSAAVSDSEFVMSPDPAQAPKSGALTLPVSGATSAVASASISDSGCVMMSPEEDVRAKECADASGPPEPTAETTPPVSGCIAGNMEILSAEKVAEMLSPEKEKIGIFKGVKTAIKTKVKSVWKKLSPKKPEKAALAASQEEASAPETEKKPIKVVTYVSATRGSLVLNSVASDEMTLDTDLPTSGSEVFMADEESIATCDTATHASRLPSLGESCSEPSEESPKHDDAGGSSGDRVDDEAMEDGNVAES